MTSMLNMLHYAGPLFIARPARRMLLLLLVLGNVTLSPGQSAVPLTPVPDELKQAVSLDLGGTAPFLGVSYHRQLIRLTAPQAHYRASLDAAVGVGFIPRFCLFGCSTGGPTTHHTVLLRWGRRLQGEVGYAGLLTVKDAIAPQVYLPGALLGLRATSPHCLVRLYATGLFFHEDETQLTITGDLVRQRTNWLGLFMGVSIGKRF